MAASTVPRQTMLGVLVIVFFFFFASEVPHGWRTRHFALMCLIAGFPTHAALCVELDSAPRLGKTNRQESGLSWHGLRKILHGFEFFT